MELLGLWKLHEMVTADENGLRMMSKDEIIDMPDDEEHREYKQILISDFIISEDSLNVFYMPRDFEMAEAEEEGWEITDNGVLIDSFPCKIVDGTLMLNYERDGKDYFPVELDDEGCLTISDGLLKIKKV